MRIPRQQFALKISSSECQGKSFTGFICFISGKASKCRQAAISRNLGWKGKSCPERVCNHFRGSSDPGSSHVPWGSSAGGLGGWGIPKEDYNGRSGERMVQTYGDSNDWDSMTWELATDLLQSGSRRGDVWQCRKAAVWKTGGPEPQMGQDSCCFGRGRFKGLAHPVTSPFFLMCCRISIFLQQDFRLKRKINTAFKWNRSWCYLNSFSRHLPSSALAQTGLFHLVCISSSLNWSSVHVIHFL